MLRGGAGEDVYRYESVTESAPDARDLIQGLDAGDVIDLSAIDAKTNQDGDNAFRLVAAFDGR